MVLLVVALIVVNTRVSPNPLIIFLSLVKFNPASGVVGAGYQVFPHRRDVVNTAPMRGSDTPTA
jgi:hypothetical protein